MIDPDDFLASDPFYANVPDENDEKHGPRADELLPRALVENAIGMHGIRSICDRTGYCLVVRVPSSDWAFPVKCYLRQLGGWDYEYCKPTPSRFKNSGDGSGQVVSSLTVGGRVLGVAHDTSTLPSSMLANADQLLVLPKPSGRVISAVIRAVTGTDPGELPDAFAAGLSFDELASAIRANSTAAECLERIERAKASKLAVDPQIADAPLVKDLHGYGEAQEWASNLVCDVEAWRRGALNIRDWQSRVVLSSKPGLGKTTLARSLARSIGCPLVASSVSQWFASSTGHLDGVIKKIDEVFDQAGAKTPTVLLLDELDSLPARDGLDSRNRDYWLPVITHLLLKLDSAVSSAASNLIIIGATNHVERLDDALLRPGRMDKVVQIHPPGADDLASIFKQHLGADLQGADLIEAGRLAVGGTGADVTGWVKTARRTAREAQRSMEMTDLLNAIAPAPKVSPEQLRRIALHEAGHAIVAHALGITVKGVSIVPKGNMSGHTQIQRGELATRGEIESMVLQALGGRASEQVLLGDPGMGSGGNAGSDLAWSTRLLGMLHLSAGAGDTLLYQADPEDVPKVLAISSIARAAVEKDLQRLYLRALELVREHEHAVDALAKHLLERQYVSEQQFLEFLKANTGDRRHLADG
jgi:ATP-dependent Zn protease